MYNGRQPLLATRAIKAQSCRMTDARIDKSDHIFPSTHKNTEKKTTCLQSYADVHAIEFNQKVVPRVTDSITKSDFAAQIYNHRRRNHCNDINNILSRTNVVQLSKAEILAVTAEFTVQTVINALRKIYFNREYKRFDRWLTDVTQLL